MGFKPLRLNVELCLDFETNCDNCENYLCGCDWKDYDRKKFGAGLILGEAFGWDVQKTRKTLSDFQLKD